MRIRWFMMHGMKLVVPLVLVLLSLALCMVGPARSAELTVSAAASLRDVFTEIKKEYEAKHQGTRVNLNFAASNPLLRQIREGAPVDVFASADPQLMDQAQADGLLVPGTRRDFALNELVLVVSPDGAFGSQNAQAFSSGLSVLRNASIQRIALGKPESVPAGRYARDALREASLWDAVEDRLVFGQHVRQVLDYVARGEADVGFVYRTDALSAGDKIRIGAVISGREPVRYCLAVPVTGKNAQDGAAFAAFVSGPEGRAILERSGFSAP